MLWLGLVVGLGWKAAMVATAVFIPGDVIKAVLAAALSISVREFATGKHGA
jgi:biotin transporter BioY